jgi:hypothetical protein
MEDITKKSFEELVTLYSVLNDICSDYAKITDMYSLASGDKLFENVPQDMVQTIKERQKFFNIRNKIKEEIKKRIIKDYE